MFIVRPILKKTPVAPSERHDIALLRSSGSMGGAEAIDISCLRHEDGFFNQPSLT